MNLAPAPGDFTVETEVALARSAHAVIAVNDLDATPYRAAGHGNVIVLGHAVAPSFDRTPHSERRNIIFVRPALGDETPNSDSLIWFTDTVLPILRTAIRPDIRLVHVGVAVAPAIRARGRWALDLSGSLPELGAEFSRARVFVAPTRFASGIPLKVCEAAAYGVPCVITPLLARQLGWTHEQEALVAENSEDFAKQRLRLFQDPELWERIRATAFARVMTDYGMPVFDSGVAGLCASLSIRPAASVAAGDLQIQRAPAN